MRDDLTAAAGNELDKGQVRPCLFVELEYDSGAVRMWSGLGDKDWDGKTWLGAGDLGKVTPIRETREVKAEGASFRLSGIPSEQIAVALAEPYQNRPARCWLGFLDANWNVIADPLQIFGGRMDVQAIEEGAETSTITVTAESHLVDLRRARPWRYTHEDQQVDYPGDKGLEFVTALQDATLEWGP